MKYVILYGVGYEAENFIYHNMALFSRIVFCIDRYSDRENFHGKPILRLENLSNEELRGYQIIVAASKNAYFEIKKALQYRKLSEFKDFFWSQLYGKKVIVANTNCYGPPIINYLNAIWGGKGGFFVYPTPMVHENINRELDENLLNNADVYIHQNIKADNKYGYRLSDEYILPRLKDGCQVITIPNCIELGYWCYPNIRYEGKAYVFKDCQFIVLRDTVLDEAYQQGCSNIMEYRKYWNSYRYNEKVLKELYEDNMERMIKRETLGRWDITMSDYIKKHYRDTQIYSECRHLTGEVYGYIGDEILKRLNIKAEAHGKLAMGNSLTVPILPSVKEFYGMKFSDKAYINAFAENEAENPVDNYIRSYIWFWYDKVI
ncbi:MAG: hypothetical protein IJT96_08515 [Lachnospiraceae bacterium]|nr:hypothetical protein [Lachnospiraceae bacterium]